MKIEREKEIKNTKFKPVTLIITIEDKEELFNLYQRLFISDEAIQKYLNKIPSSFDIHVKFYNSDGLIDLYKEIIDIIDTKYANNELEDENDN